MGAVRPGSTHDRRHLVSWSRDVVADLNSISRSAVPGSAERVYTRRCVVDATLLRRRRRRRRGVVGDELSFTTCDERYVIECSHDEAFNGGGFVGGADRGGAASSLSETWRPTEAKCMNLRKIAGNGGYQIRRECSTSETNLRSPFCEGLAV